MKMLAVISEKIIISTLLEEFYTRNNGKEEKKTTAAFKLKALNTDNKLGILFDVRDDSGILYTKIPMTDLVPFEPDLTLFDKAKKQLPELDSSVEAILAQYSTTLYYQETSLPPLYNGKLSADTLEKFRKLRALLGAGNLCYGESSISQNEEYLMVTATKECPCYTDTIKAKIA